MQAVTGRRRSHLTCLQGRATAPLAPRPPLPLPWQPLLSNAARRRGLAFYGSGRRIERVAARLLAGLPITAATLGGSVTVGAGSTGQKGGSKPNAYPQLFFRFLNASFPHRCAARAAQVGGVRVH